MRKMIFPHVAQLHRGRYRNVYLGENPALRSNAWVAEFLTLQQSIASVATILQFGCSASWTSNGKGRILRFSTVLFKIKLPITESFQLHVVNLMSSLWSPGSRHGLVVLGNSETVKAIVELSVRPVILDHGTSL